jgi:hypothetical protein
MVWIGIFASWIHSFRVESVRINGSPEANPRRDTDTINGIRTRRAMPQHRINIAVDRSPMVSDLQIHRLAQDLVLRLEHLQVGLV